MSSKPPDSRTAPTLKGHLPRRIAEFSRRHETCPFPISVENAARDICRAYQLGEGNFSESHLAGLLKSIPPERVDGMIPGHYFPLRPVIEHIAWNSQYQSVRLAAGTLLGSSGMATESHDASVERIGFSKPPARIKSLEILRGYIEGKSSGVSESELNNAIDALKFEKGDEVAKVLAEVAFSCPFKSVRDKARDVLLQF